LLPWGTTAYKLNVLSALCASAAAGIFVLLLVRFYRVHTAVAALAACALVGSPVMLGLSLVSEMYTMGVFFLCVLLYLTQLAFSSDGSISEAVAARALLTALLLLPLALATRMDLVLSTVYALVMALTGRRYALRVWFLGLSGFMLLGAMIFLYLPIRSAAGPLVNWGDPSTLGRLLDMLMRKSHGSTLDLLSQSYAPGSMFVSDIGSWSGRVWQTFGPLLVVVPVGLAALWSKRSFWPVVTALAINVPLFLYLANLPPNPHAMQVLQDHFLPGLVFLALAVACGISWFVEKYQDRFARVSGRTLKAGFGVVLLASVAWRASASSQRQNFKAYDYAGNVMRSAPPGAIVVLHEDVQLFSAWERYWRRQDRKDIVLVATGLSGTPWYKKALRERWGYRDLVFTEKLESAPAWESFIAANPARPVYAGFETDTAGAHVRYLPNGLLTRLCRLADDNCASVDAMQSWEIIVLRGRRHYEDEKLFFNQDLLDDYARGAHNLGRHHMERDPRSAERAFLKALSLRRLYPQADSYRAFLHHKEGRYQQAAALWVRSCRKFDEYLALGRRYKTMPDVLGPIKSEYAYALTSLGAVYEILGKTPDESLLLHRKAVEQDPGHEQARYNLAAMLWRLRRYDESYTHLKAVLAINPGHADARRYAALLEGRR
ncbi:MAG: tetratricopeptide repeat protein, partial [Elusimicrobiota bacterium]